MAVNVKLLNDTLNAIKANPDHWEQSKWHCGTSHCLAGFAELLSLGLPVDSNEDDLRDNLSVYNENKSRWSTRENAIKALGLNDSLDSDDDTLFAAYNTFPELEKMVAYLSEHGSLNGYHAYSEVVDDDNEDSEGWSNEN